MLRLCLDLNIWVAALFADGKGRTNTASQYLVEVVRSGNSPAGSISLVISWGMLDELRSVLIEHLNLSEETATSYTMAIAGRADFLVTANFRDFIVERDTMIASPAAVNRLPPVCYANASRNRSDRLQ
jgi:hypothetical protein